MREVAPALPARLLGASACALAIVALLGVSAGACRREGLLDPVQQCFAPYELGDADAETFDAGTDCPGGAQLDAEQGPGGPNAGCNRALSDASFDAGFCCYEIQPCDG